MDIAISQALDALEQSNFRSKFRISPKYRDSIDTKGQGTMDGGDRFYCRADYGMD